MWEVCKIGSKNNDVDLLLHTLKQNNLSINTIYAFEEYAAPGSLLHYAVYKDNDAIVTYLMQANIDVNLIDGNFKTSLHWASYDNSINIVKSLLQNNNIELNICDIYSRTPLHWAVYKGIANVAKLLIKEKNTDVNICDNYGRTPLHWSTYNNNFDSTYLLQQKSDVNKKDNYGRTSLHWAVCNSNIDIVRLLLQKFNIDANVRDNCGRTPLHWASYNNNCEIAEVLLKQNNIDAKVIDNYGRTPLQWAVDNKSLDIFTLLQKDHNCAGILADSEMSECIIDVTTSHLFKWRRFGRLIGMTDVAIDILEHMYDNNYERVYQCIAASVYIINVYIYKCVLPDENTIDWNRWREMLLDFNNGGEIVDIIESVYHSQLNLTMINNQVHICVHKKEELIIVAHNANIDENFLILPFATKVNPLDKHEYRCINELQKDGDILKVFSLWLTKYGDPGFAIRGYDAKKHLESLDVGYIDKNPYKDSYVLVYSANHNLILNIDTNPATNINTAIRNNRTNIRYLRTLHQCLIGKSLVFIPVILFDNSSIKSSKICDKCARLQLITSRRKFEKLEEIEKWWDQTETLIREMIDTIRGPSQTKDIKMEFLNSINSLMQTLNM